MYHKNSFMKRRIQLLKGFLPIMPVPCIWLFLRVKDAIENVAEHVVLKSRCTTTSLHAYISSISLESWGHWPDQAKPTLENENMIALQGPPIWDKIFMKSHLFYNLSGLFQNFYNKIEQKNLVKLLTYKNVKKNQEDFGPIVLTIWRYSTMNYDWIFSAFLANFAQKWWE